MTRNIPILALALLACAGLASAGDEPAGFDAAAAFAELKALEGTWVGTAGPVEGEGGEVTHEFDVTAAGTVVMETMMAGTDHEMVNVYYLEGDSLVLTHYCAGGNQPTMRLDLERAGAGELPFVFTGGSNLDPALDGHVHDGTHYLRDGALKSRWTAYVGGKADHELVISLRRAEG